MAEFLSVFDFCSWRGFNHESVDYGSNTYIYNTYIHVFYSILFHIYLIVWDITWPQGNVYVQFKTRFWKKVGIFYLNVSIRKENPQKLENDFKWPTFKATVKSQKCNII